MSSKLITLWRTSSIPAIGVRAMSQQTNTWALVLAAGDGSRLRALTTAPSGTSVPKQFCSLHGGPSLLQEALNRALAVVSESRTCAVVAEQHRRWWEGALHALPAKNVIVQPQNRGTAIGILLPLLHILSRDLEARVVLLPSDHYVRQEALLTSAIRQALECLQGRYHESVLLGLKPEDPDPDLGYILPGSSDGRGALTVARFVEKPPAAMARELIAAGGLWNAFIVVSTALSLLGLFLARIPDIVNAMRAAQESDEDGDSGGAAMIELYKKLPTLDFSRDIVAGQESAFRTLPVPQCGWSDLGTPKRVAEALSRCSPPEVTSREVRGLGYLSLAEQHRRSLLAQCVAAGARSTA
jgi:mannose-1-phosphate guanylyltransferase